MGQRAALIAVVTFFVIVEGGSWGTIGLGVLSKLNKDNTPLRSAEKRRETAQAELGKQGWLIQKWEKVRDRTPGWIDHHHVYEDRVILTKSGNNHDFECAVSMDNKTGWMNISAPEDKGIPVLKIR